MVHVFLTNLGRTPHHIYIANLIYNKKPDWILLIVQKQGKFSPYKRENPSYYLYKDFLNLLDDKEKKMASDYIRWIISDIREWREIIEKYKSSGRIYILEVHDEGKGSDEYPLFSDSLKPYLLLTYVLLSQKLKEAIREENVMGNTLTIPQAGLPDLFQMNTIRFSMMYNDYIAPLDKNLENFCNPTKINIIYTIKPVYYSKGDQPGVIVPRYLTDKEDATCRDIWDTVNHLNPEDLGFPKIIKWDKSNYILLRKAKKKVLDEIANKLQDKGHVLPHTYREIMGEVMRRPFMSTDIFEKLTDREKEIISSEKSIVLSDKHASKVIGRMLERMTDKWLLKKAGRRFVWGPGILYLIFDGELKANGHEVFYYLNDKVKCRVIEHYKVYEKIDEFIKKLEEAE